MVSKKFTLGKKERLKSRKQIDELFASGEKFTVGGLRCIFIRAQAAEGTLSFGAGVSAKHFKKAVDRNRIKRLLRESWRLQKNVLFEAVTNKNITLNVFIIYSVTTLPVYHEMYEKVGVIINRLNKVIDK